MSEPAQIDCSVPMLLVRRAFQSGFTAAHLLEVKAFAESTSFQLLGWLPLCTRGDICITGLTCRGL